MNSLIMAGCMMCVSQPSAAELEQLKLEKAVVQLQQELQERRAKAEQLRAAMAAEQARMQAEMAMLEAKLATLRKSSEPPARVRTVIQKINDAVESEWILGVAVDPSNKKPGVLLSEVLPEGPAAKTDLKKGDRVIAVNGIRIEQLQDLQKLLGVVRDQAILVKIERIEKKDGNKEDEKIIEIKLTPTRKQEGEEKPHQLKWEFKPNIQFTKPAPTYWVPPKASAASDDVSKRLDRLEKMVQELIELQKKNPKK